MSTSKTVTRARFNLYPPKYVVETTEVIGTGAFYLGIGAGLVAMTIGSGGAALPAEAALFVLATGAGGLSFIGAGYGMGKGAEQLDKWKVGTITFHTIGPRSISKSHQTSRVRSALMELEIDGKPIKEIGWTTETKKGIKKETVRVGMDYPANKDKTLIVEDDRIFIEFSSPYKSKYLKLHHPETLAGWHNE